MHLAPPTNHVFVDLENVCEIDPAILENKNVTFTLLLGAGQTKLDVALVEELLLHAASVQLVRLTSRGKNALDFALAYYLGHAVAADPTGFFHIVSKDTGFDPLIEHLQSKHSRVGRHDSFATLTFAAPPKPTVAPPAAIPAPPKVQAKTAPASLDGLLDQALAQLRKTSANRPKSRKTLISYLMTHLGHDITGAKAESVIETLEQTGHLAIDTRGAVNYWLEQN
jgi:hypothetical protein